MIIDKDNDERVVLLKEPLEELLLLELIFFVTLELIKGNLVIGFGVVFGEAFFIVICCLMGMETFLVVVVVVEAKAIAAKFLLVVLVIL